ncbi:MAG TPA: hypothetical protein VIG33_03545 [Pseudobdellovibrionaceae bacterium]|jgi:hypothetical protein
MGISLSPDSYDQVKLCFDDVKNQYTIVETYKACPAEFLEQTTADPCKP